MTVLDVEEEKDIPNILGRPAASDKSLYSNFYSYRTEHKNPTTTTTCARYIDMCICVRIKKANGIHCNNPRTSDEVSDNK